jgi:hypothetical protein
MPVNRRLIWMILLTIGEQLCAIIREIRAERESADF